MTFSSVSSWKSCTAVLFVMLLGFAGCNQNRYQPAEWRAAPTLPESGDAVFRFGTTLPGRGTTLPSESWTTLPQRGFPPLPGATTLPDRYWLPDEMTTMPWRNGMTTLPQRLPSTNMTTLPYRAWPGEKQVLPGTTLPGASPNPLRNR
jgi:hypothetical protein